MQTPRRCHRRRAVKHDRYFDPLLDDRDAARSPGARCSLQRRPSSWLRTGGRSACRSRHRSLRAFDTRTDVEPARRPLGAAPWSCVSAWLVGLPRGYGEDLLSRAPDPTQCRASPPAPGIRRRGRAAQRRRRGDRSSWRSARARPVYAGGSQRPWRRPAKRLQVHGWDGAVRAIDFQPVTVTTPTSRYTPDRLGLRACTHELLDRPCLPSTASGDGAAAGSAGRSSNAPLASLAVELHDLPMTPRRVWGRRSTRSPVAAARRRAGGARSHEVASSCTDAHGRGRGGGRPDAGSRRLRDLRPSRAERARPSGSVARARCSSAVEPVGCTCC